MSLTTAKEKLKEKKGSGTMIACVVAMFFIMVMVVVGMAGVKLMNEYTTLDTFGDQYIQVMAQEGCTSNNRVIKRFSELVDATGLTPDVKVDAPHVAGSSTKVQYGDTITLHLTLKAKLSAFYVSIPVSLTTTKSAESEQYWK